MNSQSVRADASIAASRIESDAMAEPMLTVYNKHPMRSEEPPHYDTREKGKYFGYFQNAEGEQWLFIYDRTTKTAILKGGDVDWPSEAVLTSSIAPYVLGSEEKQWLAACWKACGAGGS
jgi:hypothetical protein